jgi:nucleoside-diphosphate-sugar epimerase
MRVFLTGATGFIGRHLTPALSSEGHRVVCLVRSPSRAEWLKKLAGVEVVQGEIMDEELMRRCAADADIVFHLAACTRALRARTYYAVNGEGAAVLARAAAAASTRIILVSSLSAAGPCTSAGPASEEDTPSPVSDYGRSKLLGEELLRRDCPASLWTIIRPPVVYGPWDRDVLLLFRLARLGIILQIAGRKTEVSTIHVEDLVRALLLAGRGSAPAGQVYHLSDGRVYTRDDVARILRSAVGRGVPFPVPAAVMRATGLFCDLAGSLTGRPPLLNSDRVREAIQPGWVCSGRKIEEDLDFSPAVMMEDGFRSTYEWYRENGWL